MAFVEPKLIKRVTFHYDVEALADCKACNGAGYCIVRSKHWKEADTPYPPLTTHYVSYEHSDEPCVACKGAGKIRRIVEEDVDPDDYKDVAWPL